MRKQVPPLWTLDDSRLLPTHKPLEAHSKATHEPIQIHSLLFSLKLALLFLLQIALLFAAHTIANTNTHKLPCLDELFLAARAAPPADERPTLANLIAALVESAQGYRFGVVVYASD